MYYFVYCLKAIYSGEYGVYIRDFTYLNILSMLNRRILAIRIVFIETINLIFNSVASKMTNKINIHYSRRIIIMYLLCFVKIQLLKLHGVCVCYFASRLSANRVYEYANYLLFSLILPFWKFVAIITRMLSFMFNPCFFFFLAFT